MLSLMGALIVGLICGVIASALVPGKTPGGLLGVTVVGIMGGLMGNLIFGVVGLEAKWFVGSVLMGVAGSVIVLVALNQVQRKAISPSTRRSVLRR